MTMSAVTSPQGGVHRDGLVPPILGALGTSAPVLRAAIAERCGRAS